MAKKKNGTEVSIAVVLDRSGSMEDVRDATIKGFNSFLKEQAKLPGARFSLTQFDTVSIETPYVDVPVEKVAKLSRETYRPRGGTPLYDAVGEAVRALEQRELKGKVIVAIVTDGEENSSSKWTHKAVFDLVSEKRAAGWEFVFMGADVDAYAIGTGLGVAASAVYGYANTNLGTSTAWNSVSSGSSAYRSGTTPSVEMPKS